MSTAEAASTLGGQIRRGLAWSALSNLVLRAGTLALGIVLARLLVPEEFGVYAVALTVQAVLMTLADLGLSSDLVRSDDPERRAPTVAVLGLVSGSTLALLMALSAGWVARLLNSPDAAPVIAALSLTLLLAGAGVVPYAVLLRRFDQRRLFLIAVVDFGISTTLTLTLVLNGWGVMALAVGRVVAQCVTLVLQYRLARVRPRFSLDRGIADSVLRYGVPVAGANMLSWALLNVDNVIIARSAGTVVLGYYVLAFNISTWPMSAIGQVVRSIALPAFARTGPGRDSSERDRSLATGMALSWAAAVPAGAFLSLLASAVVAVLYGARWDRAATALVALGVFGALRVAFDLMAAYLLARGAARPTLMVQVCWIVALVPAEIVGVRAWGLAGAAWAHVAVALFVILPLYLVAVHRVGADLRALAGSLWPPVAAMLPTALVVIGVQTVVADPLERLLLGGFLGSAVYALLIARWVATAAGHPSTPMRSA